MSRAEEEDDGELSNKSNVFDPNKKPVKQILKRPGQQNRSGGDYNMPLSIDDDVEEERLKRKQLLYDSSGVINLQKSNGSWELDDMIGLLSWDRSSVESGGSSFCGGDIVLWVTAIVLSYLEMNYGDSKDLWLMSSKKALGFIKKTCKTSGLDFDNIKEQADQFLMN